MEKVDIHVQGFTPTGDKIGAFSPFRFGVQFASKGNDLTDVMGFSEVKIKLAADRELGRLVLVRAERQAGGDPAKIDVVTEKECPEGDGIKLLMRRYDFESWGAETSPNGSVSYINFWGCKRV